MKVIFIAMVGLCVGYAWGAFLSWLGISPGWAVPLLVVGALAYVKGVDMILSKSHGK